MIGGNFLTRAAQPEIEDEGRPTVPGMADWADVYSANTCGTCQYWAPGKGNKGRCRLLQRRMGGRQGALLKNGQRACKSWLPAKASSQPHLPSSEPSPFKGVMP
jgi:hypothetical protein